MNGFHKARLKKYHYLFYEVPSSIPYVYYRCQYHHPTVFNVLFHLLHFLLHFAALPFSFLNSILTYIELFALCSPFPELSNKLFPSQELSFFFIWAIYCLISNYQLGLSDFTLEKHSTQWLPKLQVLLPVKASSQCLISAHWMARYRLPSTL